VTGRWLELADRVFARRYAELDLTVGLVIGDRQALVIDTRGDESQGAELAAAIRTITTLPLAVALTHAHFDHCFGTVGFRGSTVYAQGGCRTALRRTADIQRAQWTAYYRAHGDAATADALARTRVVAPSIAVDRAAEVDLGGRLVRLLHPGPGHTDHDLVVHVPDAGVLFAGDLVEQGAPPDFGDAYPLRWPHTVDQLLCLRPEVVVPGHGEPVGPAFVAAQREQLARVAEICRAVWSGSLDPERANASGPYPAAAIRGALAAARSAETRS
jgi:glyoxylase-like metal-dependent hydrolase (beta-lactamase superfamily II)